MKRKRGGEIANKLDNKTKEGTNDIINVFKRKNDIYIYFLGLSFLSFDFFPHFVTST